MVGIASLLWWYASLLYHGVYTTLLHPGYTLHHHVPLFRPAGLLHEPVGGREAVGLSLGETPG